MDGLQEENKSVSGKKEVLSAVRGYEKISVNKILL